MWKADYGLSTCTREELILAFNGQRSVVVQRPVFHPNTIDETKPM